MPEKIIEKTEDIKRLLSYDSIQFRGLYEHSFCTFDKEKNTFNFIRDEDSGFIVEECLHNSFSSRDGIEYDLYTYTDESCLVHISTERDFENDRNDNPFTSKITLTFCEDSRHLELDVIASLREKEEGKNEKCKELTISSRIISTFEAPEKEVQEALVMWGVGNVPENISTEIQEEWAENEEKNINSGFMNIKELEINADDFPF